MTTTTTTMKKAEEKDEEEKKTKKEGDKDKEKHNEKEKHKEKETLQSRFERLEWSDNITCSTLFTHSTWFCFITPSVHTFHGFVVDKVLHGQLKVADAARPSLGTDRQLPVKNPVQLSKSASCHHPSQKIHYSEQNHTPSSTMQPLVFCKEAVWGCPPSCPYRVSHGRGGVGHASCASCVSYWKTQDFISLSALQWY